MLTACAPTTPLDLIPREDLLMMEAADRLERQNPLAIRTPAPPRDINAEYQAALMAAGIQPFELVAEGSANAPAPEPAADRMPRVVTRPEPINAPETERVADEPLPVQSASPPISVDEMLARVRAQSEKQPEG
jgi:hypothetical protein